FPGVNENFGVGLGGKAVPSRGQLIAELAIVVQLAVKDDRNISRFIPNRLVAAGQVNDAEPPDSQAETRRTRLIQQKSVFVCTSMLEGRGHRADARLNLFVAVDERDPANSTHALT